MSGFAMPRRNFVATASIAAAAAAATGVASVAQADEAQAPSVGLNGLPNKYETDILIIGGGQSGFSAGLRALELGAEKVMLIDKVSGEGDDFAGSSYRCGGTFLIPTANTDEAKEAYIETLWNYGEKKTDRDLIAIMADRAIDTAEWMMDQGVEYTDPVVNFADYPDILQRTTIPHVSLPLLRDNFIDEGGQLVFNTKALHFNIDANGVCGVMAQDPDGFFNIVAKKTILCSGGYASGKQFLEDHIDEGDEIISSCPEGITGDGIYMAQEIGGWTVQAGGIKSVYLIPMSPDDLENGRGGFTYDYIVVNENGERYFDEALAHWQHGQVLLQQPNATCAYIADSKVWDSIKSNFDTFASLGITTWQADTIEELAEMINMPVDTLVNTIDEYNSHMVDDHTEGLAINKSGYAKTIDTPPYYSLYPLKPGCPLVYGGLKINTNAQVLQCDGNVIPNLFAAGEVAGGFFYNGYFGGSQMAKAAIFGHVAAENAVAEINA